MDGRTTVSICSMIITKLDNCAFNIFIILLLIVDFFVWVAGKIKENRLHWNEGNSQSIMKFILFYIYFFLLLLVPLHKTIFLYE